MQVVIKYCGGYTARMLHVQVLEGDYFRDDVVAKRKKVGGGVLMV